MHVGGDVAGLTGRHVVSALQESWCPVHQTPAPQCANGAANHHVHGRALPPEEAHGFKNPRGITVVLTIETAAFGLSHGEPHRDTGQDTGHAERDRKSTRLNSSHRCISYAV